MRVNNNLPANSIVEIYSLPTVRKFSPKRVIEQHEEIDLGLEHTQRRISASGFSLTFDRQTARYIWIRCTLPVRAEQDIALAGHLPDSKNYSAFSQAD